MSLLLALAIASVGPTKNEKKLLQPVKDTPAVQLDPNGAYILLRSPAPTAINLFRLATPPELEDYRGRRWQALQKAHAKWVNKHAEWQQEIASWNQLKGTVGGSAPEEPIEPTDDNLDFSTIDEENMLGFGPLFRFAKDSSGTSTYLQRVWPGRYVLYGSLFINPNGGATGMCVCMGTVAFDANAGEITDVGSVQVNGTDVLIYPNLLNKAKPEDVEGLRSGAITMMRLTPASTSMPIDPRLSSFKTVPAVFKRAGPVPNYYGVQVDRLTAIPGVLSYDRDKILDPGESSSGH